MKKSGPLAFCALASLALLFYVVVVHLHFIALPLLFLGLGGASYAWNGRRAVLLFLFLLPLVNSTPALLFNGYPFNYMGISLFYLSGMLIASLLKKERLEIDFPGRGPYLLFLTLLGISVFFVLLRWSNLTLSPLAFLRDTPVAPRGDRLSFAAIFPAITLALSALAPFVAMLVRHQGLQEEEVVAPLKAGFGLSFLIALVQKWIAPGFLAQKWWGLKMKQLNGGFSDFNAFGFVAGALFFYQALKLEARLPQAGKASAPCAGGGSRSFPVWADLLFLAVALAAVFLSGCRTAFLFVLAAALHFALSRKAAVRLKAAVGLVLAVSLLLAGGTLARRLRNSLAQAARLSSPSGLYQAMDRISNGRLTMVRDSARMTARFPVSGVGAGNFLFYLMYLRHGETFYEDLPLNQYLLVASETGLPGVLLFLLFLASLLKGQKPGAVRLVLAAMAGALLFNNFFWFPEALLLFWLFVALGEKPGAPSGRPRRVLGAAVLLAFAALNVVDLRPLHPGTWAKETSTPYDYGFSYPEAEGGRTFRWSGEKAGFYIYLDENNPRVETKLACGAPLSHLPGKRQYVDVYWRGKLYRRIIFRGKSEYSFLVENTYHSEGFLEFRVRPTFNMKKMGHGAESRDLGVQVSGSGF